MEGCPIALLENHSLHYIGGVPHDDVSVDYLGEFCNRVADKLGGDDSFVTYQVLTCDGEVVSGLLVQETESSVMLKLPGDQDCRIDRDDIDRFQVSPQSLMPEGLHRAINIDERSTSTK